MRTADAVPGVGTQCIPMALTPRLTVAAVIEHGGRFLMVEETLADGRQVINQPAGRVEEGETPVEAVAREVLEETAWRARSTGLVGAYLWHKLPAGPDILRLCFAATAIERDPRADVDTDIDAVHWLSADAIERADNLRSPMVVRALRDYRRRAPFPIDVVERIVSE